MKQSVGRFLLVSLLLLPFMGCAGEDGFNDEVDFAVFPEVPFIILNDTTVGSGDDTFDVAAPWFLAGFAIENNNSDFQLIVPSIRVQWEGFENGQAVEGEATLDADSACPFFNNSPRTQYAVVEPLDFHLGDADCDINNDGNDDITLFYFGGLPDADSTAYFVTVTLEGYMFDPNGGIDPVKGRVRKVIAFSTQ